MVSILQDVVNGLIRQSGQIAVVFAAALLICGLSRRASAHWRYLLWLLVLAKCLAPPVVTVPLGLWPQAPAENPAVRNIQETAPAARPAPPPPAADPREAAQPVTPAIRQGQAGQGQPTYEPIPSPAIAAAIPPAARAAGILRTWAGPVWLSGMMIYFVVAFAKSRRLHRRLLAVRRPVEGDLLAEVQSVARRMGLRHCPSVFVAPGFSQPFVWGLFRGSVYLPSSFAATTAGHRQAVLGHELAHVARCDAAVNAAQVVIQGVFFFHPLIWWANRQVRREREKCCDEAAIAALAAEPRSYSQALVDTLVNSQGKAVPVLAVAGPVRNLEERIRDIMRTNRTFKVRPNRSAVALLAVLGCFALATGLAVTSSTQAQSSKPAADGATRTEAGMPAVTMPDGTIVQLVAVTNLKSQPQRWWRADGELLTEPPITLKSADKQYKYAMVFKMPPYGDASETLVAGTSSCSEEVPNGYRVFWVDYGDKAPAAADVTYKRANGPWSSLAAYSMDASNPIGITINDIYFKAPVADNGKTKAELIYLPMPDDTLQLEAVLKDGKRLHNSNWNSSGNVISDSIFTFDAPPEQIARLELSTRPYDMATFRHISLKAGEKTQPQAALLGLAALNTPGLEHWRINKFVAEFPKTFDLSTPEAAYATINRIDNADGWRKASVKAMAERLKGMKDQPSDPQWQAVLEHARILDVWVWQNKTAVVAARLRPQSADQSIRDPIDVRHLELEDGQWRNVGNDRVNDEAQLQALIQRVIKRSYDDSAVREHATEIQAAARSLFEKIRSTDYAEVLTHYDAAANRWPDDHWQRLPFSGYYMVSSGWPDFALWICRTFKDNPIEKVEVGEVFTGKAKIMDRAGWPTVPYKLTLKGGTVLQGELAFEYSPAGADRADAHWHGMEGIDWHHQYPNGLPKKP